MDRAQLTTSVQNWPIHKCVNCNLPFGREAAWMEQCPICFKLSREYQLVRSDYALARLQIEAGRLLTENAKNPPPETQKEDNPSDAARSAESQEILDELHRLRQLVGALQDDNNRLDKMNIKLQESAAESWSQYTRAKTAVAARDKRIAESDKQVERLTQALAVARKQLADATKSARVQHQPEAPMDLKLWRKMMMLCHPDKNPHNQEAATEVTSWLNHQKEKME